MVLVVFGLAGLAWVASLGCLWTVFGKMVKISGLPRALLGLLVCQLYAYVWGWQHADEARLGSVMRLWTASAVTGIGLSFVMQSLAQ